MARKQQKFGKFILTAEVRDPKKVFFFFALKRKEH
jgi:hypothetical protein